MAKRKPEEKIQPHTSQLKKKQALIIGASSDMAVAMSHLLAEQGWNLILAGRNIKDLREQSSDLGIRHKIIAEPLALDLTDGKGIAKKIQSLDGVPELTVCFAGIMQDEDQARTNYETAERILTTNYNGVIHAVNPIAEMLKKEGYGVIAVVSSVAGDRGRQSNYHYGSAKAGLTAYLSGLRNYLYSYGVHVLTIKPGFVRTSMTEGMPLPGPITGSPEKIARDIWKAIRKKKNVIYTLWMWRYIMMIIRNIPEFVFKRLKL
ncbi:MAG: short-chain dehydrogenase [Spirochaetaceae bacterium]|nr:short-chain dehydrogenase [Spirochaetaceae bacterium]|tara:strand:+ start:21246 stop:22031 length:786 start_codon:yes stop_codon:yes gene_type:complete